MSKTLRCNSIFLIKPMVVFLLEVGDHRFSLGGDIEPSQSLKAPHHWNWALVLISGEKQTSDCSCVAGQARSCSYAAARLWKLQKDGFHVNCIFLFDKMEILFNNWIKCSRFPGWECSETGKSEDTFRTDEQRKWKEGVKQTIGCWDDMSDAHSV